MWIMNSLFLGISLVAALQVSVRDAVRAGATHRGIHREYSPTESIVDLIDESNVIIRGVVTAAQPRVVDDQDVVTDLSVQVLDVYRAAAKGKPDLGNTITLRQPGGTVMIDGKPFTAADPQFPLLAVGDEYFLFLAPQQTGEYAAARGAQSVFHLSGGKVSQLRSAFSEWNDRAPMAVQRFVDMMKVTK